MDIPACSVGHQCHLLCRQIELVTKVAALKDQLRVLQQPLSESPADGSGADESNQFRVLIAFIIHRIIPSK